MNKLTHKDGHTLYEGEADSVSFLLWQAHDAGVDLRGVDLRWAEFDNHDTFNGLDLSCADMTGAILTECHLFNCNVTGADLSYSDLKRSMWSSVVVHGATLPPGPEVKNVHQEVARLAQWPWRGQGLSFLTSTTLNWAGMVVTVAGEDGEQLLNELESVTAAAALILKSSDPDLERIPDWFNEDKDAVLAEILRLGR